MKSFEDPDNLYFLTEFIRGMELFDVIRDIGSYKNKIIWELFFKKDCLERMIHNFTSDL